MEETIIFRLKLEGNEVVIQSQEELRKVLRDSRRVLKGMTDEGSEGYKRLQKDVATLEAIQGEYREEAKRSRAEVVAGARAQEGSYNQLKAELERLRIEYRKLGTEAQRSTEGKEVIANLKRVKKEFDELRKVSGEGLFNNFDRALGQATSAFSAATLGDIGAVAGALGATGPLAAAFEFVGQGLDLLDQLGTRIQKLRGQVQQLTDLTGDDLDAATSRLLAIQETFDADPDRLLIAANALTEQLTGDFSESVDLIEKGFLAGADANGEFLDSLREYPAFFRESRLTGEQFISVISQGVDQGVFSDKAVDLIKEFELRIRELPQTTKDAIEAIGLTSEQVSEVVGEGGIGAAFTLVQEQLQQFADDSPAVGRALADIFSAAGEDAGIQFIKTLDLTQDNLDDLIDPTNDLVAAQQRQLQASEELAAAQIRLTGATQPFINETKAFAQETLATVINGVFDFAEILRAVPGIIRDNREELLLLAGALAFYNRNLIASTVATIKDNAVKAVAAVRSTVLAARTAILNAVLAANPIGIVVTALTALSIAFVAAYKRSEEFRAVIAGLGAVASEFFTIVKEALGGFLESFNQLRQGNVGAALKSFGQAVVKGNPISLVTTEGGRLAKSYSDAYQKALASEEGDITTTLEETVVDPMKAAGEVVSDEAEKTGEDAAKSLTDGFNKSLQRETFDLKPAEDSVAGLRAKVQEMNDALNRQNLTGNELEKALRDIIEKEEELEVVQRRIAQVKEELEGGIQFPKIEKIIIEDEDINVQNELQSALNDQLEALDKARLEELNALSKRNLEYEEYQKARTEINERYELERLETEKLLAVEGSREYLSILDEEHQAELEAEQRQADAVAEQRQKRLQQIAGYVQQGIGLFQNFADAQVAIQEERINEEFEMQAAALDDQQARALEGVEEGSTQEQQILAEFEQKKLELERQTAERQKELRIKQQKINIALAVGNALATVQPFIPAALIAAGIAAAKGAIELAVIQRQSFAGGGDTGLSSLAPDGSGERPVGVVHEQEYVVPKLVYRHPSAQSAIRKLERMRLAMGYRSTNAGGRVRSFAGGGATIPGAAGGASVVSVETTATATLDEDAILMLAKEIGAATREGTKEGSATGLQQGQRLQERQQALEDRTNI